MIMGESNCRSHQVTNFRERMKRGGCSQRILFQASWNQLPNLRSPSDRTNSGQWIGSAGCDSRNCLASLTTPPANCTRSCTRIPTSPAGWYCPRYRYCTTAIRGLPLRRLVPSNCWSRSLKHRHRARRKWLARSCWTMNWTDRYFLHRQRSPDSTSRMRIVLLNSALEDQRWVPRIPASILWNRVRECLLPCSEYPPNVPSKIRRYIRNLWGENCRRIRRQNIQRRRACPSAVAWMVGYLPSFPCRKRLQ